MHARYRDLWLVAGLTGLMALGISLGLAWPWLRGVLGLPLVLIMPGYALTAALLPAPERLGRTERFVLTIGLSLASAILVGVALNALQILLDARAWALALAALTVTACAAAARRRARHSPAELGRDNRLRLNWLGGALMLGAIGLLAAAVWIGIRPTSPEGIVGYSFFWLLPEDGETTHTVRIGIQNEEFVSAEYRVVLSIDGSVFQEWSPIELDVGQTRELTTTLPADWESGEARLYRLDRPDLPARTVTLSREGIR